MEELRLGPPHPQGSPVTKDTCPALLHCSPTFQSLRTIPRRLSAMLDFFLGFLKRPLNLAQTIFSHQHLFSLCFYPSHSCLLIKLN